MQFLGIALIGAMGIVIAAFFISGFSEALRDASFTLPVSRGYGNQEAAVIQNTEGSVRTEQRSPNIQSGETILSTLATLDHASQFRAFFESVSGERFIAGASLYTLFVPSDEAFANLPYEARVALNTLTPEARERFVSFHLVPQKMVAVGGQRAGTVPTVSRDTLNFTLTDTGGTVGNARVIDVIEVDNGIVYVIDTVLLPPHYSIPGLAPFEQRYSL